jgi:hypothetical protein
MNGFFVLSIYFVGMCIGNFTPTDSIWAFVIYMSIATIFYIFGVIENNKDKRENEGMK